MRRSVDRWGGRPRRAGSPAVLGALLISVLAAGPLAAGPVNVLATPAAKNEDIERAGAALQKGQVDEAFKLLQEAVRKKPDLPPARLMLARLFLVQQSKEAQQQGRAVLEVAAAEAPDHPHVYLTNGSLALADGRLTDTILNCERALALSAADRWNRDQKREVETQARFFLAQAFESRRDWAGARTHLAAWLEIDPKNGQLRQRLAKALFFLDKADDCYAELKQAVKDDPTLEPPTVTMGKLWTEKGDFKQARDWLERATKAESGSIRVHLAYAFWLIQQGEIDQAKVHVETAASLNAGDLEVLRLQGFIARVKKDFATAERTFRRVLDNSPADVFAQNHLALVLADQSDKTQRSKAVQYAEVNARANPRSAEALATLGYAYFRVGDIERAMQALQAAASGNQVGSDTLYYLALVLNDRDKADDAKKLLKLALDAKGLFVYRAEAQQLYDKLDKKEPAKPSTSK